MLNVMLVDDDLLLLDDLEALVDWECLNMRVKYICNNGQEALNKIKEDEINLVIADISMPVMDGLEFSKQALIINPRIKIILITSYSKFQYAKSAIDLGVSEFILKHELSKEGLEKALTTYSNEIYTKIENDNLKLRYELSCILTRGKHNNYEHELNAKKKILFLVESDLKNDRGLTSTDIILNNRKLSEIIINKNSTLYLFFVPEFVEDHIELIIANKICKIFHDEVSIVYSHIIQNIDEIITVYNEMKLTFEKSVFWREGSIKAIAKAEKQEISKNQEVFIHALETQKYEVAYGLIDVVFEEIKQQQNLQALKKITLRLQMIKEDFMFDKIDDCYNNCKEMIQKLTKDHLPSYSLKIVKAIEYVKNHYSEDIFVDDVSSYLGLTSDHFGKIFKREVGQSFTQYVNCHKMNIAKTMLESGEYKILEVADSLGYKTSQYFSLVFKKINNISPSECIKGVEKCE